MSGADRAQKDIPNQESSEPDIRETGTTKSSMISQIELGSQKWRRDERHGNETALLRR